MYRTDDRYVARQSLRSSLVLGDTDAAFTVFISW